jgi:hypothetical protein
MRFIRHKREVAEQPASTPASVSGGLVSDADGSAILAELATRVDALEARSAAAAAALSGTGDSD